MSHKYIIFRIDSKFFAIKIILVKEVLLYKEIDPLPKASRNIKGIFNLRGQVIPVIDLPTILGLQQPKSEKPNIIVLEGNGDEGDFGFQVDEVHEVIKIEEQLLDTNIDKTDKFGKYISCVVSEHPNHKDRLIYVIDEKINQDQSTPPAEVA